QVRELEGGAQIVSGTPGRVLDHLKRGTLDGDKLRILVLDEADEMLSMGFWEDVTAILSHLPAEKQTLLFSATLPDQIRRTALSQMREPMNIDISRDELTVEGILNVSYEVDDRLPKPRNLMYILEVEKPENAIIFVNTRDDAAMLSAFFRRQGFHALALTGELAQRDREKVMRRMKTGELQYLVATDIAARGIDISDLSHVVNYALPDFTEVYLHRVGRTGRIGKKGVAISLVSGRDEVTYTQLQRQFGVKFEKRTLPEIGEIQKMQAQRVAAELAKLARDTEITSFLALAEELKTTEQGTEVIAFLLKRHFSQLEDERAKEPVELRGSKEDSRRGSRREEAEEESYADAVASLDEGGDDERGKRKKRKKKKDKDRERRDDAPAEEAPPPVDGRVRLFVSRGSNDDYSEEMIRALVLESAGQGTEDDLGRIQLRRTHAFVEVTTEVAHAAAEAAKKGVEREEKPVTIELARTRG
ncbi:MAG: DEAD/DEAH box helicase, partial [Myxococcales bacterium]|nr:DEAD/DEAH box helicase [Myxococcales bacterium]